MTPPQPPEHRSSASRRPVKRLNNPSQPPAVILLHKPFRVLCQFSPEPGKQTLADVVGVSPDGGSRLPGFYPAGRLDHDSEGLLLLTNHGPWQARVAEPRHKLVKTYLVQVEGLVTESALQQLRAGVMLNDGPARALSASRPETPPAVSDRDPPVRYRASIPTDWLTLVIDEGRNRQVRRMTAAVGLPTLRLIRTGIGPWTLDGLAPGQWRTLDTRECVAVLGAPAC